ncbi:zinc finger protein ZFP2-like [Metopolophium dirhodum]|uniref:zinc finger protein ZFP2-like n=1 Tax=Metopolophium dirhodum TaxID=44670 RepID=UPI00298F6863|nr:zinc finger protein ZFP2-like [Metopolophium dirhodum]
MPAVGRAFAASRRSHNDRLAPILALSSRVSITGSRFLTSAFKSLYNRLPSITSLIEKRLNIIPHLRIIVFRSCSITHTIPLDLLAWIFQIAATRFAVYITRKPHVQSSAVYYITCESSSSAGDTIFVYSNQKIIKEEFSMETSKPSIIDSSINSKYDYLFRRTGILTIPLVRCDDQVLKKVIKQENIDENGYNNDDTILQMGNQEMIKEEFSIEISKPSIQNHPLVRYDDQVLNKVIKQEYIDETAHNKIDTILQIGNKEKEVNTTNNKIKTEKDIIEAYTFDGSVFNEGYSMGVIDCLNLRQNTSTSNTANLTRRIHISEFKEPLFCALCNKLFYKKSVLKRHILRHTRENTYNNRNLCYKCNTCGKRFSQEKLFKTHMRLHTKEKPHVCDFCNKGFATSSSLIRHIRTHTGKKPYKCDICDKSLTLLSSLKDHKRIHTGEKPYKCLICDKQFNQKPTLRRHTRIHTNDKPYQCDFCKKFFSQAVHLKGHKRTHTFEKPYNCKVCNKSFALSKNLRLHTRTHTGEHPYICDVCDKSFAVISNFKVHQRIHTGERPYSCNFCNKAFNQRIDLKRHTRIHTGERPYSCNFCNKAFNQRIDLKRHTRIHTDDKPHKCDL